MPNSVNAGTPTPDSSGSVNGKKRPINSRLYKTNLCRTFTKTGTCPYGAKCQFAHGEKDLRHSPQAETVTPAAENKSFFSAFTSPANVTALQAGANTPPSIQSPELSSEDIKKISIKLDSRSTPRVTKLNIEKQESPSIPDGAHVDCDPRLYKTELCRSHSITGICRYEDKCQFAHGIDELRPAPQKITHGNSSKLVSKVAEEVPQPNPWSSAPRLRKLHIENLSAFASESKEDGLDGPSSTRSDVKITSPVVKDPRVYKTELCKKFESSGQCPYGVKCQFAHGLEDLRPRIPMTTTAEDTVPQSFGLLKLRTSEDEIIPSFSPSEGPLTPGGTCDPELYKTELCRSFNRTGYCRYGLKCQFAHGIQELRPSPRLNGTPFGNSPFAASILGLASDFYVFDDVKYSSMSHRRLSGSAAVESPKKSLSAIGKSKSSTANAFSFAILTPETFESAGSNQNTSPKEISA